MRITPSSRHGDEKCWLVLQVLFMPKETLPKRPLLFVQRDFNQRDLYCFTQRDFTKETSTFLSKETSVSVFDLGLKNLLFHMNSRKPSTMVLIQIESIIKYYFFECTSIWTSIIKRLWKVKKMVMVRLKSQRYFVIYIRAPLKMQKIIK